MVNGELNDEWLMTNVGKTNDELHSEDDSTRSKKMVDRIT